MAIQPNDSFYTKDILQPGGHGEQFVANLPGYRSDEVRINRTNNRLNMTDHDVPAIKYDFDDRMPVLFRYGFAYGFNQIVVPKGRIVAIDPNMSTVDFETKVPHNVLTLANGGVPVRLREATDKYSTVQAKDANGKSLELISDEGSGQPVANIGKDWIPLTCSQDLTPAYPQKGAAKGRFFKPFAEKTATEQLDEAGFTVNVTTGRVVKKADGIVADHVRVGNIPVGMIERNEYTRDIDAYNGIMPGPIRTDALVEMPWFAFKDKAENNLWGSVYGLLLPGDLVKSDENGRITASPLNDPALVAAMSIGEYEAERRQVIGEVYATSKALLPEGSAKWATWALADRLNYEEFNPTVYRDTNRRNEDSINNSPHNSTGEYPGYPFDKAFNNSNLHMINDNLRRGNWDPRMDAEWQYSELGIPGLTDGYNAVVQEMPEMKAGEIHKHSADVDYIEEYFRLNHVNVVPKTLQIKIEKSDGTALTTGTDGWTDLFDQTTGTPNIGLKLASDSLEVTFVDPLMGIVKLNPVATVDANDPTKKTYALDSQFASDDDVIVVKFKYSKRGLAGVPTWMDWDGCVGSVHVLLTK